MSDVLEFAGVSVVRGDNTLLDDITWEVEEGQRWVVLGPNGAGKTTLLQVAAGRIHPTTGVAGVLGEVLEALDPRLAERLAELVVAAGAPPPATPASAHSESTSPNNPASASSWRWRKRAIVV